MSVGPTGVTVASSTSTSTPAGDFKIANGLMYIASGQVYNPDTAMLIGTFSLPVIPFGAIPQVEPDLSVGRVYFLTRGFSDDTHQTLTLRF
jgi:hypothetical protein